MGNTRRGRYLSRSRKRIAPLVAKRKARQQRLTEECEVEVAAEEICLELDASDSDLDIVSGETSTSTAEAGEASSAESDESGDEDVPNSDEEDESSGSSCRVVDISCLQHILDNSSVCNVCLSGSLTVSETLRHGLASVVKLTCSHCGKSSDYPLVQKHSPRRYFDLNRRSALAMRIIGRGGEALRKVCAILDLPQPLHKQSYQSHCSALHAAAQEVNCQSMRAHAADLLRTREEAGAAEPSQVAVSTDGTWMRRGYSSLYSVQSVISHETGKVLDITVLSKHCDICKLKKRKLETGELRQAEFDAWKAEHQTECQINTHVSSPAMETAAVVELWKRSEHVNHLQYTVYIGDGDSKGFQAVCEERPYGDIPIAKEECIGHVRKRLGKNLRDLRQRLSGTKLSDGKPIGGRGRLTDKRIDSLQHYYGDAIRKHSGSITDMARAIWASLCHSASTDESPNHQFCPPGLTSWCGWQREKAGSGQAHLHHDALPKAVFDAIKPVYIRLTDKPLLLRCARSATQNANEALNGLIWSFCPKEYFCGRQTVETAAHLAVLIFNDGYRRIADVLSAMSCTVPPSIISSLGKFDRSKAYHLRRKSSDAEKASRKKRRAVKKGFIDKAREKEGVTYCPGGF